MSFSMVDRALDALSTSAEVREEARADLMAVTAYLGDPDGPLSHGELTRALRAGDDHLEGNTAYFQTDGNLVVYTADHHAKWASDASGFTDATLVLRSDGNMLIMAGTKQVWSTNTHF